MAPYIEIIWNEQQSSQTVLLSTNFAGSPTKLIEILTTGFSGTLDIRAAMTDTSVQLNIPYLQVGIVPFDNPTVAQLIFTADSSQKRYLIIETYPKLYLVMTRSAGSITCIAAGMASPFLAFKSFTELERMTAPSSTNPGRIFFNPTDNRAYIGIP